MYMHTYTLSLSPFCVLRLFWQPFSNAYMLICSFLSITAIWSLSFMDFMHYLREISASLQYEMSGSSQTWNCSGKSWCLESECLSNYTRYDSAGVRSPAPRDMTSLLALFSELSLICLLLVRTTSHPRMSTMSLRFFSRPSPPTSKT